MKESQSPFAKVNIRKDNQALHTTSCHRLDVESLLDQILLDYSSKDFILGAECSSEKTFSHIIKLLFLFLLNAYYIKIHDTNSNQLFAKNLAFFLVLYNYHYTVYNFSIFAISTSKVLLLNGW